MRKILVLHGPNLNLLGTREPDIYGDENLDGVNSSLERQLSAAGMRFEAYQSNSEGELIDKIQAAREDADFIVINPGAFTHTSVALRDALLGIGLPFIEVHLTNVHGRETFRHQSYLADVAVGVITGLGTMGYTCAVQYAIDFCNKDK